MEKMSKSELTATITKQNEQLNRYENRFRDVVTAYKGLLKEKEALESSLEAIKNVEKSDNQGDSIATLTQSMTALAAEKARMEEAFQNDRRITREENEKKIQELQEQLQNFTKQRYVELDGIKAKLFFEIQEREREHTEHSLMIKELQMKLTAERRSKEKLEDKFVISNDPGSRELEKRFRDLNDELEATQRKLNRAEARTIETPQMLVQLQEEIAQMKQNHIIALREERIKAKKAEESAKRICTSQEERIAALEARLAELSDTVGEYDRQRRRDQEVIQQLKENVGVKLLNERVSKNIDDTSKDAKQESILEGNHKTKPLEFSNMIYLQQLIEKIHSLKKEVMSVNENMGNPIDIWNIFNITESNIQNIHSVCEAEISALKSECNLYKKQLRQNSKANNAAEKSQEQNEIDQLKFHIKTLQDKVEILNQQMDETEKECEIKVNEVTEKLQNVKVLYKEDLLEHKSKIQLLEEQLETQRGRYVTLLSEREGEIKSRQEKGQEGIKDKFSKYDINNTLQEVSAPPHMLHYVHEIARKDLEISGLRKEKHLLEGQLRDVQKEVAIERDRFKEVRRSLKEEIDRLCRIQSREGANLEYLKNVVLSYLLTTDSSSKRRMLNAIAAVLHFTKAEKEGACKMIS